MGVVWLAFDDFLHREVAVKEILPRGKEVRDTDPEVRRAMREARAAAKLSKHPGIITVHDIVADDDGLPWIVMEVLRGPSLRTVLEAGPVPPDRAARICEQVLAALDYAHTQGVLHRDVKPGNVMLVGDQAVLTDFGIALLDGVSVITATGQLPGSPEYVAPERIRGKETRPAADLWSVGVMLYGMLVGRTPFQRDDIQATMGAVLSLDPDPDPRVGALAPVVNGLLRKDPAERMSAREAMATLRLIKAVPAQEHARPATPAAWDSVTLDPTPPPRRPRSRRGLLVAAGAVLAVAALALTIVLMNRPPDGETTATPPATTTSTPLKPHQDPLGFEIDVPADWQRSGSANNDQISQVIWTGPQADPTVGPLEVRVKRDATAPGTTAITYLTGVRTTLSDNRDNIDYHTIELSDHRSSAVLEYTYQAATGSLYFHERVTAMASGEMYTLTFSTFAGDASTIEERWRAAGPLFTEIRRSFRLTS